MFVKAECVADNVGRSGARPLETRVAVMQQCASLPKRAFRAQVPVEEGVWLKRGRGWCSVSEVFHAGNTEPFVDYKIKCGWIVMLLQGGKIDLGAARNLYVQCGMSVSDRLRDLDAVEKHNTHKRMHAYVASVQASLQDLLHQPKLYEGYLQWRAQFSERMMRRRILILTGPSYIGKSQWVRSVAHRDGGNLLELTLSGNSVHPDMRSLQFGFHTHVLFDEASVQFCLYNRKMVQGGACVVQMGQSATNMYAYEVCTYGLQMVCCNNTWDKDLGCVLVNDADRAWLVENTIVIREDTRCWELPSAAG